MSIKDSRIDEYIFNSADFAKPILIYLRELIHKTCPDVQETIKWGFPNFEYKGSLCYMASFKQHCAFGFSKSQLMNFTKSEEGMGNFGKITSLKDLPSEKKLIFLIKEAMKLNENGVKVSSVKKSRKTTDIEIPEDFLKELSNNKKAKSVFENFSPSHKREYAEWIAEAKREETRKKRIKQAIEWISEGKHRNWKYEK
ncbi:MAG: YdeI/OmpD-associated family protein [Ignavibacterium sp.]|nr:YdeI/OmpD-associated family protein [Ignavibacterium sp.]MDW8375588.1 YdeI/OmpD-associated family protein [Ignavibacteriales bacterium]